MIRWNLFFEVEKVEQLALIDPLATHHDRPPSLKASGKRNHDSSIFTRPFSTGSVRLGHSAMSAQCPVCPKADTTGAMGMSTLGALSGHGAMLRLMPAKCQSGH